MNSTSAADPSTHPVSPVSIAIPTPRRRGRDGYGPSGRTMRRPTCFVQVNDEGRSSGAWSRSPSVVQSVLEPREPLLEVADAAVAFLLAPPAEREPRGQPQRAHARDRTDRPLGDPGGCGQASLELAELPVQAVPGGVDLPHRFSCCFAHRTSSFSDSWVSAGLV